MKRKLTAFVLALAITCSLTGCGASGTKEQESSGADTSALKIAIVSSPSGVDDGSFNEDNYKGILDFIDEYPDSTVTPIQETTGDTDSAVQAVADIVADYNVIVCCGFQFAGIGTIAEDNPDTKFVLVDAFPTDSEGNTVELDNVYGMCYAEQESAFCAGVAAALTTTTGKVAVVNAIAYPSNVNYQTGFEKGVQYINENGQKEVECVELPSYAGTDVQGNSVGGNYIGSFSDEATGKVVGQALMKAGADVIFVAAGGSGNGVFTAAKEGNGVKVIGCDVDQYDDGINGDTNIVLTSAIKNMHLSVYNALSKIAAGDFKGENVTLHADTDATGYISTEGRCQLSQEEIQKIDAAFQMVREGSITLES